MIRPRLKSPKVQEIPMMKKVFYGIQTARPILSLFQNEPCYSSKSGVGSFRRFLAFQF